MMWQDISLKKDSTYIEKYVLSPAKYGVKKPEGKNKMKLKGSDPIKFILRYILHGVNSTPCKDLMN